MALQVKNVNELRKCVEENQKVLTSGKLAELLRIYGVCGGGSKGLQQRFIPVFAHCKVKEGYDLTQFELGTLPEKQKSVSKIEKMIENIKTVAAKYGYKLEITYTMGDVVEEAKTIETVVEETIETVVEETVEAGEEVKTIETVVEEETVDTTEEIVVNEDVVEEENESVDLTSRI